MECFLYPPGRSLGGAHTYRTVVRLVIGMVHSDIQTESKVTKTTGLEEKDTRTLALER